MRKNYLCYMSNKSMIRVPDDIFDLFLEHLEAEHPEYLCMQDFYPEFSIRMFFLDEKLIAFTVCISD